MLFFLFTPLRFPLIVHLSVVRILHDLRADDRLFALRGVACGLAVKQSLDLSIGERYPIHFCDIHTALTLAVPAKFTLDYICTAFRAFANRLMTAIRKRNRLIDRTVFTAHISDKLLNARHEHRFGQAAVFDLL